jgi:glutamate racemase
LPRGRPIGIFDSGLGGLTVVRALKKVLPFEEIVYLGDTARLPYGTKSAEAIRGFAFQDMEFLISRNVKLAIVACHSASSVALEDLQRHYRLPIIGVIEPGARAAVEATRNNRIGVIGTNLTIGSGSYERAIRAYRRDVEIIAKATPLFVPLAEEGWLENDVAYRAAMMYLQPFRAEKIDTLLLGCTHYPLLKHVIARALGKRITLVDSSEETARTARTVLEERGLNRLTAHGSRLTACGRQPLAVGRVRFYLSDLTPNFRDVCSRFLGEPVNEVIRASIPE